MYEHLLSKWSNWWGSCVKSKQYKMWKMMENLLNSDSLSTMQTVNCWAQTWVIDQQWLLCLTLLLFQSAADAAAARGERARALCKAPAWLRRWLQSVQTEVLSAWQEVDLDRTRASLYLVGRNSGSKVCRHLPTSHYLDLMGNCHYRTHLSRKDCFRGHKQK